MIKNKIVITAYTINKWHALFYLLKSLRDQKQNVDMMLDKYGILSSNI